MPRLIPSIHPLRALSEKPLRLPRLSPYTPNPDDPSIFWFNGEREDIMRDVAARVVRHHGRDGERLELSLNDAAYHEIRRLRSQRDTEAAESLPRWQSMVRRLGRLNDGEKRDALARIVERYAEDVVGNFDPRVYQMARHAIPRLITGVMRPAGLPSALVPARFGGQSTISDLIEVDGSAHRLAGLQKLGTLVYVPTHSSNLDSVVLGQALEIEELSPVVYGAGKNLFSNPIISFFMHNLGAYRVDRRIRTSVYKDVLKMYSQVLIERGYHSLFFPGGTRSRSNLVEHRLKLGLAGSAVSAFSHNRARGIARNVFFVPTTINYELVLEGESLVEDWLKAEGQARYVLPGDEFSQIDRWVAFFQKVVGTRAAAVIRFGDPIDPFGNPVDDEGRSITPSGHSIDPGTYVEHRGVAVEDPNRDAAYTRDLGELLIKRYREDTVLMTTSLVAHVLFRRLVRETPGMDLYHRVRVRGEISMDRSEYLRELGELRDRLLELERAGQVRLNSTVREASPTELLERALKVWNGYHSKTAATVRGGEIVAEDPLLLLYYQNRMVPFADRVAGPADLAAAEEIGRLEHD